MTLRKILQASCGLFIAAAISGCSAGSSQSTLNGLPAVPGTTLRDHSDPGVIEYTLSLTRRSGYVPWPHRTHRPTWVPAVNLDLVKKKGKDLLFVSDQGTGDVDIYNWQDDEESLLGKWTGFNTPYGMCSNKHGDVYMVDYGTSTIYEFSNIVETSFGLIRSFADTTGRPIGCSVDPKNGDLAVTNFVDFTTGGDVLLYPKGGAGGAPNQILAEAYDWPAGYDPHGNLFLVGEGGLCTMLVCLEELPAGKNAFEEVNNTPPIVFPAATEWDGEYLGMGDQNYQSANVTGIYQVSIGADGATVASTSGFNSQCYTADAEDFVQWAFDSEKPEDVPKSKAFQVTAGNLFCTDYYAVWDYPQAGINPPILTAGGTSIPTRAYGQTLTIYGK